jgi:hypothetical protein
LAHRAVSFACYGPWKEEIFMKKLCCFIFAFVICFGFLLFDESFSEDDFNYGKMWNSWNEGMRLNWVWGFSLGQDVIFEELQIKDKEKLRYYISPLDAEVITGIMTKFYADAANSFIPWKYLAYIAKMKLNGVGQTEIEKELELLRRYADWLRKPSANKDRLRTD